MKNIIDICKDFGFEIPADKHADFLKAVNGEYKTIAEFEKVAGKLDTATKRAETAEEALKSFDGIDPANIKTQLEEANRKIKEAEENAQKQLDERDFNDALRGELDALKFSSSAARKSIETEIRNAGLKLKNGKILGLSDLIEQMKKDDAEAFVDAQNPPARFTAPSSNAQQSAAGKKSVADIMSIKDRSERRAAIAENLKYGGNN